MKITAKVIELGPVISGVSTNGNPWEKQTIVVESLGLDTQTLAIDFMGESKTQITQTLRPGDEVEVTFSINCHQYNDRWYTRLDGQTIKLLKAAEEKKPQGDLGFTAFGLKNEEVPY